MTQNNPHNEMPKDTVEEILATLEKSLEEKFNKVVKALIQNINGTFSEGERKDICNKLNQDGINEIRDALTTAYNQEAYARGYKQGRFDAEMDILNEDRNAGAREVVQRIMPWVEHDNQCILQRCERGEPTEDGGYRTMYAGVWYKSGEEPDCDCGLEEALSHGIDLSNKHSSPDAAKLKSVVKTTALTHGIDLIKGR